MKMKAFSILLVFACLAVALMLVGNTADAKPYSFAVKETTGDPVLPGERTFRRFQLEDLATGEGVPDVRIDLQYAGITIQDIEPAGGVTDDAGQIIVFLTVDDPPKVAAYLTGTPYPEMEYAARATALFNAGDAPDPVKLVVLPPQETQYQDGLLKDLPVGFEAHWLEGHWVDYCDAAERDLRSTPQPIRLADGPRYHPNNLPANAQAYRDSVGNLFTAVVEIRDVRDLSAWQMDVAFNPQILKALRVREGKFLAKDSYNPFFLPGLIDNNVGVITGIAQARVGRSANIDPPLSDVTLPPSEVGPIAEALVVAPVVVPKPKAELTSPSPDGVSTGDNMAGILFCIDFQVLEFAEESLGLHNVQLSNSNGARLSYYSVINPVVVTHKFPAEDVNRDRCVDILDLMAVAGAMPPPDGDGGRNLGRANPINPRADVNDDGIINALDLIAVSSHVNWAKYVAPQATRVPNEFVGPAAPALVGNPLNLTPATIQGWIDLAQVEDDGSAIFDLGIAKLKLLLQATVPERTKLLLNYPNPFNPETWIPYQLAKATDVSVSIYSVNGALVRTLALGHQAAGVYQNKSRAAYWDGRNELGERVASGVYFYTLTAGDFSATGKMLIRK